MKLSRLLGATALAGSLLFVPNVVYAQDEPAQSDNASTDESGEDTILVTGSRIRRPNLESNLPVTTITGEEFFQQGQTNIGDTLNELPQLRSTFAQQNPGLGIGIAGLNLLDLRGLGTVRTLVLVNGRRHVAADVLNNAVSPDVNTIPNDLIERVDVVTGGNSSVYGSDAIAGVVNFILRRDFEGLQVRGNAAISQEGFGGNQYVSAMYGTNFADGRGNVTLHAEYAHQERIFASDIDALQRQDNFVVVDTDPGGTPNGSDGNPDRVLVRDLRSASINRYGLVPISNMVGGASPCGVGINGSPYNCTYVFDAVGGLSAQTGTRLGSGVIGSITGGNGQTGREEQLLSVLPFMERYNTNLLAHYTFSDAFEAFVEAKYVRVNVQGSNFGPSFIQGTFGQFDSRERVRLDNPYLTPAQRTLITNAILASGCNPSLTVTCTAAGATTASGGPLNAANLTAIANGSYRFVIARHLSDVDIRDERFERETYRFVGGFRGTFNEDWNYELSVNYGKFKENTFANGYLDKQRFLLALDSGIDPLNPGAGIQCRSKFDNSARIAFPNSAANQARLAADIAACVPYNPFGAQNSAAAIDYVSGSYTNRAWAKQFVVSGFVGGDLSQLFELPGGPIRFALGGEYRKEQSFYGQDDFAANGNTTAVAFGTFDPPAFDVKEAFAELQIPLLKDEPFFHDLTLSGAARMASYGGGVGTVWAYNAGIEWAPIRDIRFRANYGRAIRAPNSSETYGDLVPNFAPGFQDPCRPENIGAGSATRATNCQADLGALLPNLTGLGVYSLPVLSGVNPDLQAEKSNSLTIGAVIEPRFLPGFSLTVDYYDIKVNGVIASLTAQQIANGCYDAATLSNPFCALFVRYRGPGAGPLGETPGQILGNTLIQAPFNYAKRVRRGIDVDLAYRTSLGQDLRLDTRLIYSHQLKNSNYQDPTRPTFENRIMGELGDPKDEFRLDVALKYQNVTLGYQGRYIGSMYLNAYEDFNSLNGLPPADADYADVQKYPSVLYHDIRIDVDLDNLGGIGKSYKFFAGVDNVFDRDPPFGSTATGAGSAIYNIRGRVFYSGFKANF